MKLAVGLTRFPMTIPDDVCFDDLNWVVYPDGSFELDESVLRRIAQLNAPFDPDDGAWVMNLLEAWYNQLRLTGYRHQLGEQWLLTDGVMDGLVAAEKLH